MVLKNIKKDPHSVNVGDIECSVTSMHRELPVFLAWPWFYFHRCYELSRRILHETSTRRSADSGYNFNCTPAANCCCRCAKWQAIKLSIWVNVMSWSSHGLWWGSCLLWSRLWDVNASWAPSSTAPLLASQWFSFDLLWIWVNQFQTRAVTRRSCLKVIYASPLRNVSYLVSGSTVTSVSVKRGVSV